MAFDKMLLSHLPEYEGGILHLYDWKEDSITYGHFIDPKKYLNLAGIEKCSADLARRPTGGGIVFHHCDLAFSVLVPSSHADFSLNSLKNYAFVNHRVTWAIEQIVALPATLLEEEPLPLDEICKNFCMAKPTKYDVIIQGKKVGGAAQRKTRYGYLHQGSIFIGCLQESYLREMLLPQTRVIEKMRANSFSLLGEKWTQKELSEARQEMRCYLKQAFIK